MWVVGHLVTQFQGQILRAAANNRVRGHASVCGYSPPSPTQVPIPHYTIYSNVNSFKILTSFKIVDFPAWSK